MRNIAAADWKATNTFVPMISRLI